MVEMELLGVRLERPLNQPVVLLREQAGERRVLPIYIGPEEAKAIAMSLEGLVPPRPFTHDLMRDLLAALGATVTSVTVTELHENAGGDATFFAEIELLLDGRSIRVSSRPSDGVALAVRVGAPLFANEVVLAQAAVPWFDDPAEEEGEETEEIVDEFRQFLDDVNPEDFAS